MNLEHHCKKHRNLACQTWLRIEEEVDLQYMTLVLWLLILDMLAWIFHKLLICLDFYTKPYLQFTEIGLKMKKISSEQQPHKEKCLC